jgi:hypothetical protein
MQKEELNFFIKNHPENYAIQLKRTQPQFYNEVCEKYNGIKFGEKLYNYVHGNRSGGKCGVCGNPTKFDSYHKGYRKTCSYKCLNSKKIVAPIVKKCPVCSSVFETDKRHDRKTCSIHCQEKYIQLDDVKNRRIKNSRIGVKKKYGVDNVWKIKSVVEKSKKTKLKKYGSENYVNPEKAKQTKLKNHGDQNYNNTSKAKETCLRKYGVNNPSKILEIVDKANTSKFEKFGEKMISENAYAKLIENLKNDLTGIKSEAAVKTMMSKYGTVQCMQVPEVAAKVSKTAQDNFYNSMASGSRLDDKSVPSFSREKYVGTRGENDERIFYKFGCKKCEKVFTSAIEDGIIPECPNCYPKEYVLSKPETEIFDFIREILPDEEIIRNSRSIIPPHEIDIYLPTKKIAIELNGNFWHSENGGQKDKFYHINKTKKAHERGIKMIHVLESEWALKKQIVKRKILSALIKPKNTIFARKCKIKHLDKNECKNFLEKYHIQGSDKSSIKIGAYYENKLVSVMTFGKNRVALGSKNLQEHEYEMYRFCIGEYSVVGIGSKLLKFFIQNHTPKKITTFADIRYSSLSAFYEKIGFSLEKITSPNYWYFNKKEPFMLKHRFNFQKAVLKNKLASFDETLTEWENMKNNDYDRIWDCGNLKYVMFFK